MKTTFKALVLAASLSMIAGSAFAVNTDLTSLTTIDTMTDAATATGLVQEAFVDGGLFGADMALEDNVAVIAQFGNSAVNFAFIDQSTSTDNVAVIVQDSVNNANSAAILQVGTLNRASINQR